MIGGTRLFAGTFTVTNTNDTGPGSLRQAILDANAAAGSDTIGFDIPDPGVHTISPATVLIDKTFGLEQPSLAPTSDLASPTNRRSADRPRS